MWEAGVVTGHPLLRRTKLCDPSTRPVGEKDCAGAPLRPPVDRLRLGAGEGRVLRGLTRAITGVRTLDQHSPVPLPCPRSKPLPASLFSHLGETLRCHWAPSECWVRRDSSGVLGVCFLIELAIFL